MSFLKKADVFGVNINIKYEDQKTFQSKVGGLVSLILVGAVLALLYQSIMDLSLKNNPNIIYEQVQVDMPGRYYLTPDNFSFMIALQKNGVTPFIDNTIYNMTATFVQKYNVTQSDGTSVSVTTNTLLDMGPCTKDDFKKVSVQSYFWNLDYKNCYCFKNATNLYLEGQIDREKYGAVQFKFNECVSSTNCKDSATRQKSIKGSTVVVYFSNPIISLQNYDNPFTFFGKSFLYNVIYEYLQTSSVIFQNSHIVDDNGLFTQSLSYRKELTVASDRQQLAFKSNEKFLQFSIYLQNQKEDQFTRTYSKIPQIVSQMGGLYNILFLVGALIIRPYNENKLQKILIANLFSSDEKSSSSQPEKKRRSKILSKENFPQNQQSQLEKSPSKPPLHLEKSLSKQPLQLENSPYNQPLKLDSQLTEDPQLSHSRQLRSSNAQSQIKISSSIQKQERSNIPSLAFICKVFGCQMNRFKESQMKDLNKSVSISSIISNARLIKSIQAIVLDLSQEISNIHKQLNTLIYSEFYSKNPIERSQMIVDQEKQEKSDISQLLRITHDFDCVQETDQQNSKCPRDDDDNTLFEHSTNILNKQKSKSGSRKRFSSKLDTLENQREVQRSHYRLQTEEMRRNEISQNKAQETESQFHNNSPTFTTAGNPLQTEEIALEQFVSKVYNSRPPVLLQNLEEVSFQNQDHDLRTINTKIDQNE